jgi:hypothetical protein
VFANGSGKNGNVWSSCFKSSYTTGTFGTVSKAGTKIGPKNREYGTVPVSYLQKSVKIPMTGYPVPDKLNSHWGGIKK